MYQTRVRLLGLAGVCVSLYALHVELKMEEAKQLEISYEPACATRWGSCATVFSSRCVPRNARGARARAVVVA